MMSENLCNKYRRFVCYKQSRCKPLRWECHRDIFCIDSDLLAFVLGFVSASGIGLARNGIGLGPECAKINAPFCLFTCTKVWQEVNPSSSHWRNAESQRFDVSFALQPRLRSDFRQPPHYDLKTSRPHPIIQYKHHFTVNWPLVHHTTVICMNSITWSVKMPFSKPTDRFILLHLKPSQYLVPVWFQRQWTTENSFLECLCIE